MNKKYNKSRGPSKTRSQVRSKSNRKSHSEYGQASGNKAFTGHYRRRPNANRYYSGNKGQNKYGKKLDISAFINKQVAITQENETSFIPEHSFDDFNINANLKNAILKKGYETPTPIQDEMIPHILNGKDVVGIANTGTGKTAAFLIPLINKVLNNPSEKIIIVAPTRELANQIHQELRAFVSGMNVFSVCCVGGTSIVPQMRSLSRKNNFVIGTPGRLKDLIERKKLNLHEINTIVLDEADTMLDMGFIHDMRYLVAKMPAVHHTLFFSATLSKEIEKLISAFLNDPIHISLKTRDTAHNIEQDIIKMRAGEQKIEILHKLLIQPDFNKVLIFGRTKHGVEKLSRDLFKKGFSAESIHGNKNYNQRQRALATFKENKLQILVATDVAARGLDIPNVSHVINYDMPGTYEDYIHRVGRTGRWGKKGKALTFV
ncbi:MAG: DEAD/DEAH box helicase [Candidatus Spechtbacterales bacterium]